MNTPHTQTYIHTYTITLYDYRTFMLEAVFHIRNLSVWVCYDLATFNWYIYFDSQSMVHIACMSIHSFVFVLMNVSICAYTHFGCSAFYFFPILFLPICFCSTLRTEYKYTCIYRSTCTLSLIIMTDVFIVSC